MGLSKKRKQHLSQITSRSLEIRKHRKVDRENQRIKDILRRQRKEEEFWDEYKNPSSEFSFNESNCDGCSQDGPSSKEEDLVVENKRRDCTYEGLGNEDGGVQLGGEERALKPTWREDAGGYLRWVTRMWFGGSRKTRETTEEGVRKIGVSNSINCGNVFSST